MPIVEGGLLYEGRCNILIEAGHFYSYKKGNYSHFTDTENHPKHTIRYSEYFRTWAPDRTGVLFLIPCPEFQQVCNRVVSVSVFHPLPLSLSHTHTRMRAHTHTLHFTTGCLHSFVHSMPGTGDRNINKILSQGAHSLIGETNI